MLLHIDIAENVLDIKCVEFVPKNGSVIILDYKYITDERPEVEQKTK